MFEEHSMGEFEEHSMGESEEHSMASLRRIQRDA
jgi:hypothetical protein